MLELMQQIIYDVTGKRGVTMDTDFITDLELNSFDIMNIISAFEDHFGATIPNRDVWHLRQVRDAIEYIQKRGFSD